jgi:hypothetical protein
MNCINIKSKEFQELLEASGLPSIVLEMRISKWQEINESEEFPSLEEALQPFQKPIETIEDIEALFQEEDKSVDFSDVINDKAPEIFNSVDVSVDENLEPDYSTVHSQILFGDATDSTFSAQEIIENILSLESLKLDPDYTFLLEKAFGLMNKSGAKVRIVSEEEFLKLDEKLDGNSIMAFDPRKNEIFISKEVIAKHGPDVIISAFIHETSHSTSVHAYNNPFTPEQKDFKDVVDSAYEQYKFIATQKGTAGMYGFENPLEFISEIYSNEEFRKEIQEVEGFWVSFINSLRRLFGLPMSLKNHELIESSVLFNAVDNLVQVNQENWQGDESYGTVLEKRSEDIFSNLSTIEDRLNHVLAQFDESISKNIKNFKTLQSRVKTEEGIEQINEYLTSLYELREDIKRSSDAEKIKSIVSFLGYMDENLSVIERKLRTAKEVDYDGVKNIVRYYDEYLSLFSVIDNVQKTINELIDDETQELADPDYLLEIRKTVYSLKGHHSTLVDQMNLLKRNTLKTHLNQIKYFPDVEKKHYERLAKEHRDGKLTENKETWIAKQMNIRDKDLIAKDLEDRVNQIINNPVADIWSADVMFSTSLNVSNPMIQIMNQMLIEIDNKRIKEERLKDVEFKNLFNELVKEKGTNDVRKLYKNIIQYDKNGQPFLYGDWNPDFYTQVHLKINELRKEYDLKIENKWLEANDAKYDFGRESQEYLDLVNEIRGLREEKAKSVEKLEKDNITKNKKGEIIAINEKWKNPKPNLTEAEQKVLDFFKGILDESGKVTNGKSQNLIKYSYSINKNKVKEYTMFYELPKINKSDAERVWGDGFSGIIKDKIDDLKEIRPDDVGYDTRERGVDGRAISRLKVHFRSNNFDHKNQSMDLMNVFRLEYKNTNRYKIRKDAELELGLLLDVAKEKEYLERSGTRYKVKANTGKVNLIKGHSTQTFQMMTNMMESKFYDIMKKSDSKIAGKDLNKIVGYINNISSTFALSLNVASATANVLNGNAQLFLESFIKGHHIKAGSVAKANAIYSKHLGKTISDNTNAINTSFVNQLLEEFNTKGLINLSEANFLQSDLIKKGLSRESLQLAQSSGEHWLQSVITMSILDGIKVMNADLNFIDKDGNVVSEDKAASLLDMHEMDESTGFVSVSDKVVYTSNSKMAKYNEGGKEKTDMLLYKKIADSIGNYRQTDQADVYRHWLGSLTMLYRKYLVPMGLSKFRGIETAATRREDLTEDQKRFSYALQEYEEGTYTTLLRYIITSFKDKKYYLLSRSNWENLSDYEKHNIKRAVTELVVVNAMLPIMTALLSALAGDDDESYIYFLMYQLRRLDTELSQYMSIRESFKILRSPIPSARIIETAGSVVSSVFPWNWDELSEEYKQGNFKGENKMKIKIQKQIPGVKEFLKNYKDYYEFQDSNWGTGL